MSVKNDRTVPLAVLLKRELTSEKVEKPDILHGQANQSKKGEDFTLLKTECQRIPGDGVSTFAVFALFDGHNGSAAATYSKENLLNNVLSAIPSHISRDEWLAALPRALVAGFIKTDKDFQEKAEGSIYSLSADHRLESNEEERERITACGGEVGRLNTGCGAEIGPLRCWPGGLCLSRSIGDMDVGEFIVPIPFVKQVKLSNAGGRLIISSDGVWDALTSEMAVSCSSGLPADVAAKKIVKESIRLKGLRDDTTCIVVDILPPEKPPPLPPRRKNGKGIFKSMFCKKTADLPSHTDRKCYEPDLVEEIYEEGSAKLAERLAMAYPLGSMFKLFVCAVCQVDMKPGEGISVHSGSCRGGRVRPWDGPFLCPSCLLKKDAMEGKRPSGARLVDR
ncbi:probable protein phosphatase 2C 12 isoform X2 [Nymphaea colorata]|uniref:probable protein phosphatase 2C 12 isoform X2 n=1 Tax=Nymphaea colorata TaxID=210225 RepID=UPI00214ECB59|nr:probable protein phosphatase 2C 12 isoform X2 [Nymphaea colorata]